TKEIELDLESENEEDTESTFTLEIEFLSFKIFDFRWFELYSKVNGFAFCVTHSDIDKDDQQPWPVVIIEVLQQKYPGKYIHARNVYNLIQMIRYKKRVAGDAGSTYLELIKKQHDEPDRQSLRWSFLDATKSDSIVGQTNRYLMKLCVVIVIDNHNCSRLVATAVISDEVKETFSWVLENLAKASNGLAPKLLFTDADCGMVATINETLPSVQTMQWVESYNSIIKKHFNGASSLFELSKTIDKLLIKEVCKANIDIAREPAISTISTISKMEMELTIASGYNVLNDDAVEFATKINNPVSIKSKGRKPKNGRAMAFNDNQDYNDYENIEEFSLSVTRHNAESLVRIADKDVIITTHDSKFRHC
ncbi:12638_t:CDS:10, partial [Racocetra fulgida]